ncbi:recombinase family protein [Hymenobacter aquaticus]|uniref:Recombinase family protein n=1 Tax=Hymenobacter aquaticus TaxID=1867101 RepID=A0A4Z0Q926_9BACT|nr:recombinase family protein [Hymenobacter aquaticus]TGE25212.1 recombinase family protein [Hymenobacter aquaticus]
MSNHSFFRQFAKRSVKSSAANNNAVIYTRVSTKEQADNNQSLDIQRRKCLEHATSRGYTIMGMFGGTHESAKNDERKEFNRMLRFVKQKSSGVSRIIVLTLDRFSRSGANAIAIAEELKREGIFIEAVTQQIDTRTTQGQLSQNINLVLSHFENQQRRERAILGMTEKLLKGYWVGKAPLGYTITKVGNEQKIIINEQGRALRKAFHMKVELQLDNTEIARWLRGQGVKVSPQLLTLTFRNVFYCGFLSHSLLPDQVVPGRHPKLISEEMFRRLNDLQASKPQGYVHAKEAPAVPLKNHVRCHRCDRPLTAYIVRKKGLWYYKCNTVGCKMNVSARALHQGYKGLLSELVLEPHLVEPFKAQVEAVFHSLNQESAEARREV